MSNYNINLGTATFWMGDYRIFFRKCKSCGQTKVVYIQKKLEDEFDAAEGYKHRYGGFQILVGARVNGIDLCESCAHLGDRVKHAKDLENRIDEMESYLDKISELSKYKKGGN